MKNNEAATFWQHLDILRWVILRSLGVAVVFAVVAFCLKDWLFAVVLAPRTSEFITFRWLGVEPFSIHLMNTGLTEQFMTHMRVAMYAGLLCAAPYIIYELFRFVSGLCDVYVGHFAQLFSHFPPHRAISGHLSSQS